MTQHDDSSAEKSARTARAFDIRTFIAALIGLYGVILVAMGLFATSDADRDMAGGVNVNLWAGLGMVVAAALFQGWAMWRPVVVPAKTTEPDPAG